MKWIITAFAILCSCNTLAATMVCKEWGYANSPDDFHSIKLEKQETSFVVSEEQVVKASIGRVYSKVDPESFDLVDLNVTVYKLGLELLYIYEEEGKTNIGISHLVEDSDTFFGDKELFADCKTVIREGRPQRSTSQSLYATIN